MKLKVQDKIKRHSEAEYPREVCGLIVIRKGCERYVPCKNAAPDNGHFIIPAQDFTGQMSGEMMESATFIRRVFRKRALYRLG